MCFSLRKYNFLFVLLFLLFLNNKGVNVNRHKNSNNLIKSVDYKFKTKSIEIPEEVNVKGNIKIKKIRITVKTIRTIKATEILLV